MKHKPSLDFADVQALQAAALEEAIKHHWAVSISIVDEGGQVLSVLRMDGAAPISASFALAKATTAALGRRDSKGYEDMINSGRISLLSAPHLQGMVEGGIPLLHDGHCVGAVGVSGAKSAEDAQIARAASQALDIVSQGDRRLKMVD
jgi:glc operon protein GlcG